MGDNSGVRIRCITRANALKDELGASAPKFVQLTNDVVFDDLWRRSDLNPRDRSLVTIAALAAMGDEGDGGGHEVAR